MFLLALAFSASLAGDIGPDRWTQESTTDPVELTTTTLIGRADEGSRAALLVDCGTGRVYFDVGAPLDVSGTGLVTFRIRFDADPTAHDLAVRATTAVPTMAEVDDLGFVATLAARESEKLHLAAPLLRSRGTYSFGLDGTSDALRGCGVDLDRPPLPENRSPEPAPSVDVSALQPEGVRVFHHSELRVKRRVQPPYPAEARGLGEVTCRVRMYIDEEGVPERVEVENCPTELRATAEETLMQWRWYPAEIGGEPVKAQFLLALKFIP